ncbi:uncharacterized protein An07g03810 [Aspergillus niger]|uniref:Contig An07c0100, genomic contig n=2 Tax=Aspergillus niger TaxID=5061 RepID=A2QMZ0_ASPNC|nr:uncharacterized protein An07g03810 [Aspergillus niger]CAK48131.1 unnamed protein product [Aspergillus niger]
MSLYMTLTRGSDGENAHLLLIAPLSANTVAEMVRELSDNLLLSVLKRYT